MRRRVLRCDRETGSCCKERERKKKSGKAHIGNKSASAQCIDDIRGECISTTDIQNCHITKFAVPDMFYFGMKSEDVVVVQQSYETRM